MDLESFSKHRLKDEDEKKLLEEIALYGNHALREEHPCSRSHTFILDVLFLSLETQYFCPQE